MKDIKRLCDLVRQTAYEFQIKKYVFTQAKLDTFPSRIPAFLFGLFAFLVFCRG
jgi:hypothetical protein